MKLKLKSGIWPLLSLLSDDRWYLFKSVVEVAAIYYYFRPLNETCSVRSQEQYRFCDLIKISQPLRRCRGS